MCDPVASVLPSCLKGNRSLCCTSCPWSGEENPSQRWPPLHHHSPLSDQLQAWGVTRCLVWCHEDYGGSVCELWGPGIEPLQQCVSRDLEPHDHVTVLWKSKQKRMDVAIIHGEGQFTFAPSVEKMRWVTCEHQSGRTLNSLWAGGYHAPLECQAKAVSQMLCESWNIRL